MAPAIAEGGVGFPLFPVATHKFIVLSICSFGLYQLYWCYQVWKGVKSSSGENLSPFWRAVFAPLWSFSLFGRIHELARAKGVAVDWRAGVLAGAYLALSMLWRLPDPWWWVSFASVIPMIPVQQTIQRINEQHGAASAEARNDGYSAANVATIAIGGLFLALAVVGTFLPE